MNKEYTYFEAMEEIIKDESKVFIGGSEHNKKLFYNRTSKKIKIADKSDNFEYSHIPTINYFWINTKWTLAEEKKNYNVRVYSINDNKLISSKVIEKITKSGLELYCKSKAINGILCSPIIIGTHFTYRGGNRYTHKIVVEEIITT